jgi:hypothetical protein
VYEYEGEGVYEYEDDGVYEYPPQLEHSGEYEYGEEYDEYEGLD